MEKSQSILQQVFHGSELPVRALPSVPLVEILGCERVLVENHISIASYDTQQIYIRVKYGMIMVQGKTLQISYMSSEKLIITGKIDCVHLLNHQCL